MNKKYIAFCSNIPLFWDDRLLKEEFCKNIYGASWIPILAKISIVYGYEVISGNMALKNNINPQDVFVIQELNSKHGKELLARGAKGVVLTACESPIISFYFYDNIKKIAKNFQYRKLFNGSFDYIDNHHNINMHYPAYFITDEPIFMSWETRKFSVMVAGNKSTHYVSLSYIKGFKNKIKPFLAGIYKIFSPSFRYAKQKELHSTRIEIIKYFGEKSKLNLFGLFWLNFDRLKKEDRKTLEPILIKLNPIFCKNKIETIKNYKYVFCLENIKYKGYVTEKIIDCFIAGTIPIYLGATNIEEFIPKNCFIDLRNYKDMNSLENKLDSLSKLDAITIIENGRKFLKSEQGRKFSYEYYARDTLDMVESVNNDY